MDLKEKVKLSKFISLILRHQPDKIGIKLDEYGWANVDELINGINKTGRFHVDMKVIEEIVRKDEKQRYLLSEDKKSIRANQGHSISVNLQLEEKEPPEFLFHGTATRFLDSIYKIGINKGNRLYVHLSKDIETAEKVGERHGKPVILKIKAQEMYKEGYKFYISVNNVWLTDEVPVKFFEVCK